ncbi:MAG TPA: DUF5777 family beta-barrel protein [Cyclobacteriaceae bacterium]|jgi:hypothetical protein|nr:DUF5777 family beta-barrel protein [Cyclobacteriaceae bacterium]
MRLTSEAGRRVLPLYFVISVTTLAYGQEDLLAKLGKTLEKDPGYATATFKSTRVINSQSIETLSKGNLDFRISHRFGRINSGSYNFFGLDQATIRLALEYGLTNSIMVGVGRSSFQKTFDGFIKAKVLRQRKNENGLFPVSITWFSNTAVSTLKNGDVTVDGNSLYRYSFAHQLIIARKFTSALSLQVAPILIHQNLKEPGDKSNDTYAIGFGGRIKMTKRVSINADYIYRLPDYQNKLYYNSASMGVDIETGGHVFQLHLTNSQGMIEQMFVSRTDGQWSAGDIYYGFNISRQFKLRKK